MSLRDLAAAGGVRVGAAVNDQIFGSGDEHYRSLLADEFNSVTAERAMKWLWIHPEPDHWDWEASDELVEFAEAHQMQVRGHTVVWPHWGTPDYITQCADAGALRQYLVNHVRDLFSHWAGSVARVDLVNEPLHWLEGRPADSVWRTLLGEDYLADVLTVAHEADSSLELWINETHTEVIPDKHDLFTRIVTDLVERDLPLHGIGIQGHQLYPDFSPGPPDPDQLYRGVTTFADMGLEVAVTEMDVLAHPTDPDRLDVQGRIYGELVDAALSVDACREVTFWGVSDAHSWVDEHFGADRAPLLFDREGNPKPAYDAVAAAFASRARRTPVG